MRSRGPPPYLTRATARLLLARIGPIVTRRPRRRQELKFGDNDNHSALTAALTRPTCCHADRRRVSVTLATRVSTRSRAGRVALARDASVPVGGGRRRAVRHRAWLQVRPRRIRGRGHSHRIADGTRPRRPRRIFDPTVEAHALLAGGASRGRRSRVAYTLSLRHSPLDRSPSSAHMAGRILLPSGVRGVSATRRRRQRQLHRPDGLESRAASSPTPPPRWTRSKARTAATSAAPRLQRQRRGTSLRPGVLTPSRRQRNTDYGDAKAFRRPADFDPTFSLAQPSIRGIARGSARGC